MKPFRYLQRNMLPRLFSVDDSAAVRAISDAARTQGGADVHGSWADGLS